MVSFENDYNKGAHTKVLEALIRTNDEPLSGYGYDPYTESAANRIREACEYPDAGIYFLTGGTQTNAMICTLLQEYEGVVAADTGHVAVHEAGAIENTGHKVLTVPGHDGKIHADELEKFIDAFYKDANHTHMIFPGMVYISFPTELGTIYTKQELTDIHNVCQKYQIPLYADGARLGYGLMSKECDLTLPEFARLVDVFYIGGTKVGALCGEAVVFTGKKMPEHFETIVKRHGSMLAKGRLNAVQFDALFTDNLYFDIARNAIEKAEDLKSILKEAGFKFFLETPTNQQFVIVDNETMAALREKVVFSFWDNYDENHTVIRFVTSYATTDEEMDYLRRVLS